MRYHDEHVRNVRVRRLQCDEIWAYVGAKAKNVTPEKKEIGWGDIWTWVGLDADTKLVVTLPRWRTRRGLGDGLHERLCQTASRVAYRSLQTATKHTSRLSKKHFGMDVDYATIAEDLRGIP